MGSTQVVRTFMQTYADYEISLVSQWCC